VEFREVHQGQLGMRHATAIQFALTYPSACRRGSAAGLAQLGTWPFGGRNRDGFPAWAWLQPPQRGSSHRHGPPTSAVEHFLAAASVLRTSAGYPSHLSLPTRDVRAQPEEVLAATPGLPLAEDWLGEA